MLKTKSRMIARKNDTYYSIPVEHIAFIAAEKKVYIIDSSGERYLCEGTSMSRYEEELDPELFFRANRKYIVNVNFIRSFRKIDKVRLQLSLLVPKEEPAIVISQAKAGQFKKWIHGDC